MVIARRRHRCGRQGCNRPRFPNATFCRSCWALVPRWLQARITAARQNGDAAQLTRFVIMASEHVSGIAPAINPNTARIAALTGEDAAS